MKIDLDKMSKVNYSIIFQLFNQIKLIINLLIFNLFINNVNNSIIDSTCKCIIFNSTYAKDYGIFHSPNWPLPYEDDINCLLYTFQAKNDQIVEITFDEFDVQKANLECTFRDYVQIFLNIPDNLLHDNSTHNQLICGKLSDIEQTYYSSHSSLIFKFKTDWRSDNSTGFYGTFRFLKKSLFQTDGKLLENTVCDYIFNNTELNRQKGRFFSNYYPSNYAKNSKCKYTFIGRDDEYVRIVIEYLNLQKIDVVCLNSADYLEIHDGLNKSDPVIGLLCGVNNYFEFKSTNNTMFIQFVSKSLFPSQGFRASYYFEPISSLINQRQTELDLNNEKITEIIDDNKYQSVTKSMLSFENRGNSDCNKVFSSDVSKSGEFSSPNYPHPYPAPIHCIYNFTGRGKERVKIKFNDFNVYKPEDTDKDCNGADVLMVYVTINGLRTKLDNLCGVEIPPQLMSNDNYMMLEFKTYHQSAHTKGFSISYEFTTNFGIYSGKQDHQKVCGFVYSSKDSRTGNFTSPNWPGYYPRDTECHYFFLGETNERVLISFSNFKVEGILPCTSDTASDYVEFSNYKTVDRKIPRHCGNKIPNNIESDGDFFRITFKSNDRFDEVGFKGTYEFKKPEDTNPIKHIRATSQPSPSSSNSFSSAFKNSRYFLIALLVYLKLIGINCV